jgi:two-component system CheB/CheR fusion protein
MSRLDLLVCRNTLMYFNSEAQASILRRFHFGLNEGGFLYLGRAEMLLTHGDLFRPVDLKHRVFAKVPEARPALRTAPEEAPVGAGERLRGILFESAPWGQILVSQEGAVVGINERARSLFDLGPEDRGKPFRDLEVSYRPVELRSLIGQAQAQRVPITIPGVEWRPRRSAAPLQLEVQVLPLLQGPGPGLGAAVLFTDITEASRLRDELRRTHTELETAYEELQSTNEELETTNEEIQSSNEELETTNEELQSSNEELETMNEELQSSNEELQTLNDELRVRSEDVNHANAFMESVLTSLRGAVVSVDDQLVVQVWSRGAEDLWGLRKDEAESRALLELDIGLPMDRIRDLVRASQDGSSGVLEAVVEATNRRGKAVRCRITCAPRLGPDRRRVGLILLMEELEVAGDGASR